MADRSNRDSQLYFHDGTKRCPFCGGKAILKAVRVGTKRKYTIGCLNVLCLAYPGYGSKLFDTEEDAIRKWNARSRS